MSRKAAFIAKESELSRRLRLKAGPNAPVNQVKPPRAKPKQEEDDVQEALCKYVRLQYPRTLFKSELNGVRMYPGLIAKLAKLKSSRGFCDFEILEPRGPFCGFYLELKRDGEKLLKRDGSPASEHIAEQMAMTERLRSLGYFAGFAIGLDQARALVDWYFKHPPRPPQVGLIFPSIPY